MVDKSIIDKVLKKFLTAPRDAGYLRKKEYEHLREPNKEYYLSSAWLKSHWSWDKLQSFCANMVDDTKHVFLCGLPYQLPLSEGLLMEETVISEMSETDFDELSWSIEMEALWFGESETAFFRYEDLLRVRKTKTALYPRETYAMFDKILKQQSKQSNELRILCADIAVMSSRNRKNNDATAIFILQLLPTKDGQYIRNVLYSETYEGGHTETQALIIRRLYEQMSCDYIVIDTAGVGVGVYDNLVKDLFDSDYGIEYEGFTCMNDTEMASRYKGRGMSPQKVIYSVKATPAFNSECALSLRDCLKRGKMTLLITEQEYEELNKTNKSYKSLPIEDKLTLKMPYVQTTLLITELINLEYTTQGTKIKIYENADKRKDRYTSLAYGNYFANELERKLRKPKVDKNGISFLYRAPIIKRK